MDLIDVLKKYQRERKSVRILLSKVGVDQWSTITEPLADIQQHRITRIILNWITHNLSKEEETQVRLEHEKTQDISEIHLKNYRGCLRVTDVVPKPELRGQLLYYWPPIVTYASLTEEQIIASMTEADNVTALQNAAILEECL